MHPAEQATQLAARMRTSAVLQKAKIATSMLHAIESLVIRVVDDVAGMKVSLDDALQTADVFFISNMHQKNLIQTLRMTTYPDF